MGYDRAECIRVGKNVMAADHVDWEAVLAQGQRLVELFDAKGRAKFTNASSPAIFENNIYALAGALATKLGGADEDMATGMWTRVPIAERTFDLPYNDGSPHTPHSVLLGLAGGAKERFQRSCGWKMSYECIGTSEGGAMKYRRPMVLVEDQLDSRAFTAVVEAAKANTCRKDGKGIHESPVCTIVVGPGSEAASISEAGIINVGWREPSKKMAKKLVKWAYELPRKPKEIQPSFFNSKKYDRPYYLLFLRDLDKIIAGSSEIASFLFDALRYNEFHPSLRIVASLSLGGLLEMANKGLEKIFALTELGVLGAEFFDPNWFGGSFKIPMLMNLGNVGLAPKRKYLDATKSIYGLSQGSADELCNELAGIMPSQTVVVRRRKTEKQPSLIDKVWTPK